MKKKILFCINTLRDGGAEKILVDIVNHPAFEKYDVEVRLIYNRGVYIEHLKDNIKVTYIVKKYGGFWLKIVSRLLPMLPEGLLHCLFIRNKYDIEVAFLEGYATKIIAGAPAGARKIAWVHCDLMKTEWIDGVYKTDQGFSNCYRKIDEVICVAESVKAAFIQRFGEVTKLRVIYNPVDGEKIRELSEKEPIIEPRNDCTTLISAGRMTYPKNFMRLLKCVNNLLKQGYHIRLFLLGDGPERKMLENFAEEQGIQGNIIFTGYVKNPYPYLRQSDLYVCSSIYEGFSTATTEALILGKAVVTTEVSGMREMLGDSEYGMITGNDDGEFEAGLKKILDRPELLSHYGKKAEERSCFFEKEKQIKEIEKLFR